MPHAHARGFPPRSPACPSDCSSGAPAPERRMARRTAPWPVARGPSHATRACERVSPAITRPARKPNASHGHFPCRSRHGEGQALALRHAARFFTVARGPVPHNRWSARARTMARDRPSPYDETEAASSTVARGPVPRDRSIYAKTARRPRPFPVPIEARRGTGPRPTVKQRRPCIP